MSPRDVAGQRGLSISSTSFEAAQSDMGEAIERGPQARQERPQAIEIPPCPDPGQGPQADGIHGAGRPALPTAHHEPFPTSHAGEAEPAGE